MSHNYLCVHINIMLTDIHLTPFWRNASQAVNKMLCMGDKCEYDNIPDTFHDETATKIASQLIGCVSQGLISS